MRGKEHMFSNQRPFFSSSFGSLGAMSFSKGDLLSSVLQSIKALETKAMQWHPPQWMLQEIMGRLILLINHILLKEPQALERLKRQKGRSIEIKWHQFACRVNCTPAGLIELTQQVPLQAQTHLPKAPDLAIELMEPSVISLIQMFANAVKPPLHIQGDVQLAAEINWLVDHVKWDLEDDLAKIVGDVNAHQLGKVASYVKESLGKFVVLATESFKRNKPHQAPAQAPGEGPTQ
jgi:ubiquinone biosynthesis protein UbiJ